MSTPKEQLDLFVAIIGDVPLRDDREMMSAPMVSLAKRSPKRLEWEGPSGQSVLITASEETGGIATIYDFDIILWAISQINAGVERGQKPGPTITFRPYDLMKSIGHSTGGKNLQAVQGRDQTAPGNTYRDHATPTRQGSKRGLQPLGRLYLGRGRSRPPARGPDDASALDTPSGSRGQGGAGDLTTVLRADPRSRPVPLQTGPTACGERHR